MRQPVEPGDVFRAAVLAGLLVLAGCSAVPGGLPGGGTPMGSPTVTPAPVPESTPEGRLVPGVTREGVTDPVALAAAHRSAVGERYRLRVDWTVRASNGTLLAVSRQRARVTPAAVRAQLTVRGRPGFGAWPANATTPTNVTVWSNGSVLAERNRTDGSVGSRSLAADGTPGGDGSLRHPRPSRNLAALFGAVETIPVARLETGAGTAYVVSGTTVGDRERFAAATGLRRPRNVTLRALVDERGLIRDLRLDYDAVRPDGTRVVVRRVVRYQSVGEVEAVRRPDWVRNESRGTPRS